MTYDELTPGLSAQATRTVTERDLQLFAEVSGDHNPVHLDAAYAATTPFGERIAHGMWTGSLISALIATQLPGPGSVYISQQLSFKRPVKIGDTLTTTVTLASRDERKKRVTLDCRIVNQQGKEVVSGVAEVAVP